jgi:drug/metabolite transporter (DMT)-like permease
MWQGAALAVAAACAHTCIDALRKHGAQRIPPDQLVALVGVLDAVLSCSFVAGFGRDSVVHIHHFWKFVVAVLTSSIFLLYSKVLYQRAIQIAPLSLTIPYLSFSPALLLLTAYVILGETPSHLGLLGVGVVTAGGYLLSLKNTKVSSPKHKDEDSRESLQIIEIKLFSSAGPAGADGRWDSDAESLTIKTKPLRKFKQFLNVAARPLVALQNEPGSVSMLLVAAISSVTASLDKLGVISASSISVYFAVQRFVIGVACLSYLLIYARGAFTHFSSSAPLLLTISTLELAAVVFFLKALDYLFVSYVVAIKRCNILFSVLAGGLLFKEKITGRLPYVLAMLAGMLLIVAEPGHHRLHSHVNH